MINIRLKKPADAAKVAGHYNGKIRQAMRTCIKTCLSELKVATPIRTGRARYGYYCSKGKPFPKLPEKHDGMYPELDVEARMRDIGQFTIKDKLYITNNLPYISRLNRGWSKQAPARFVERCAARARDAAVETLVTKS